MLCVHTDFAPLYQARLHQCSPLSTLRSTCTRPSTLAATSLARSQCGRMFPDRSAVALHLEAGSCSSGVTRAMIDNFMRTHDQQRLVTAAQPMLIEGPASNSQTCTMYATERSYDHRRQAYVCVLCNNTFKALRSLNAHLSSPRHAYTDVDDANRQKLYKCPNKACNRPFTTLSGVIQHAEYGGCGVLQVRGMNRALDQVLGQTRMITY